MTFLMLDRRHAVNADRIVAICKVSERQGQKLRKQAEEEGKLLHFSERKATHAWLILDTGHVIRTQRTIKWLCQRLNDEKRDA